GHVRGAAVDLLKRLGDVERQVLQAGQERIGLLVAKAPADLILRCRVETEHARYLPPLWPSCPAVLLSPPAPAAGAGSRRDGRRVHIAVTSPNHTGNGVTAAGTAASTSGGVLATTSWLPHQATGSRRWAPPGTACLLVKRLTCS